MACWPTARWMRAVPSARSERHAAEHGVHGVHGAQAGGGRDQQRGEGRAIGGLGGQARQAEERQRGDDRSQREHLEQPRRAVRRVAGGGVLELGMGFGMLGGGRTIVGHVAMPRRSANRGPPAGAEIVVRPAQVMPEVVGHVNPQGVAAQADQGQEKLEDQDGCPHRGTDHKDDGHRYLLAEELRNPQVFRPPKRNIGQIDPFGGQNTGPRSPKLGVSLL